MYAFVSRAKARKIGCAIFKFAAIPLLAIGLAGCAGFFGAELNNRGGYIDQKLDSKWMHADTKQMRILRAYVMIGSLARMSRENYYKSERQLIAQHVNTAVNVAFDAYACAYSRPGDCVYFDERMAELEVAVIRLAVAVFSKHENESLFQLVATQADDNAPILKVLFSAGKVVDAASTATEAVASTGKLIKSLLSLGEAAYFAGRRAGALYRDSIELAMIASLGSLDLQCAWRNGEVKAASHEVAATYRQFYGAADSRLDPCAAFRKGLSAWKQGAGDLSDWKTFLETEIVAFRFQIIPGESAFIQASDLVWRACEQIAETPAQLATCLGHRGVAAETPECGIDNEGKQQAAQRATEATKKPDPAEIEKLGKKILAEDNCRLLLYGKTWASRQLRRGKADARIFWLSMGDNFHLSKRADIHLVGGRP